MYTRILAKNLHVYMTFGQKSVYVRDFWPKTCMYTRIMAKNLHVYMTFGQKSAYVHDFWPKTCIYIEDSGKNQAKGQTNKGECQSMDML